MTAIATLTDLIELAISRNARQLTGDRMTAALLHDGDTLPRGIIATGQAHAALRLARTDPEAAQQVLEAAIEDLQARLAA